MCKRSIEGVGQGYGIKSKLIEYVFGMAGLREFLSELDMLGMLAKID